MAHPPLQCWTNLTARDTGDLQALVDRAQLLERDGWDGATFADSQCIRGETWLVLGLCAQATKRLKLGPGVTNPATRHPSVTAAAAATLQMISNGRAVLGFGRGDSSLAHIGASPVSVADFERALEMIQSYLRGGSVPLAEAARALGSAPAGLDKIALAHAPDASRLKWLGPDAVKPPVDVACTGPKVIAAAARHADCISFSVSADLDRLRWAADLARSELRSAGRDPAEVPLGAYLPLYPHHDLEVSRELAKGLVTALGRLSTLNKTVVGPVTDSQQASFEALGASYDMDSHGRSGGAQTHAVGDDFIDTFALVGAPERCLQRIREITALGITRLHLYTAATDFEQGRESYRLAADEVLPALRAT